MNQSKLVQISVPNDIAVKIALSLQVSDVCSLGSCSRYWRELCGSDCLWAALYRDRWLTHALNREEEPSSSEINAHEFDQVFDSTSKVWRGFYINKHNEMAGKAASIVDFVEQSLSSESIKVGHYLTAIENLRSMQFGFKDIQMFFLKPKLNVLLNLIGVHYCISWLGVSAECVMEALRSYKISERQVCVQWWKIGRWLYGFRLRDESHSRNVSLGDLTMAKEEEVLAVINRGAIYEVLCIKISAAKPTSTSWSYQNGQTLD
ncbi:unnamed protein product [Ilex paraguariensis]|uniref:F-box domain-containing protein n=1 Tax=Ilex paraguariensis TaxID=185542 RepID=A0ABC8SRI0_9AQUA